MIPVGIGKEVGEAVRRGGPWVVAALAILAVAFMALYPAARADSFTGAQGKALRAYIDKELGTMAKTVEGHIGTDSHVETGRNLAEINARMKRLEEDIREIKTILRGR